MKMSEIKRRINEDLKQAMKEGDHFKRDALRMLNSALKQVEVDKRIVLSDEDVIRILKSAYKQREDAASAYQAAGRQDLFDKEDREMKLILTYLPAQLDDASLESELKAIIAQTQASGPKDMGKVMAVAKNLNADGRRISEKLKALLSAL